MASQAHCAYCFETLSASLEKRHPLDLRGTLELWKKYNADPNDDAQQPQNAELEPSDSELEDGVPPPVSDNVMDPRPAAISRLLAASPSTASSSSVQSVSSTPSGVSEASSVTSKSSSRSSFFSLSRKKRKSVEAEIESAKARAEIEESPLFVTWNVITKSGEKRLRGCIGTFEKQELDDGLRSYALTSAFDDTRFLPITTRELPTLECGVTLLTDFEPITSPLDWAIGTHGLRISFTYHNRRYGSTYLPDVAREQGWTKEETLISLMRKAGWNGKKEDWRKVDLSVVRYQGRQVKLGYREWREWRDWVEETGQI